MPKPRCGQQKTFEEEKESIQAWEWSLKPKQGTETCKKTRRQGTHKNGKGNGKEC